MGIDNKIKLSDLYGDLKKWGKDADKDGNKVLEGEEISVFKEKVAEKWGVVSDVDFNAIFGLEQKNKTVAQNNITEQKTNKGARRFELRRLEELFNIKRINLNDLKAILDGTYQANASRNEDQVYAAELMSMLGDDKYSELKNDMKAVLDAVLATGFNSKEDVEKIHKNDGVKAAIEAGSTKESKGFRKNVMKMFVKQAENMQRAKEEGEIKAAYYNKVSAGMSREDAFKATKAEFKAKENYSDSYYKEILKSQGSWLYKATHLKGKMSKFEQNEIMPNARTDVRAAVYESDATSSRRVKSDVKKELKAENDYDKYTKKALNGENNFGQWLAGVDSNMKTIRKNQANDNNVEAHRYQTEEDILKVVGNKKGIFDALVESGLITKVESGTNAGKYDLSDLITIIQAEVSPGDNTLDKTSSKYKAISEKLGTYTALKQNLGMELSSGECKDLIDLCGIKRPGSDWLKYLAGVAGGALFGALAAGGAEAARKNQDISYYKEEGIISKSHIDTSDIGNVYHEILEKDRDGNWVKVDSDKPLIDVNFPEGIDPKAKVILDITVNVDRIKSILFNGGKFVLSNALKGALVGGAVGLVSTLFVDDKDEVPVAEINFDCNPGKDCNCGKAEGSMAQLKYYLETVQRKNPKWAPVLSQLALTYVNDGEWDCEGFRCLLQKYAGNDILGKDELLGALMKREKELKGQKSNPEQPVTVAQEEKIVIKQEEVKEQVVTSCYDCNYSAVPTFAETNKGNKMSWEAIVNVYYKDCIDKKHTYSMIVAALKKENGINPTDNVIPADLRLPDKLFADSDCKRNTKATEDDVLEYVKAHPVKRNNGTVTQHKAIKKAARWQGVKTCADGQVRKTKDTYATEQEAISAANDDTKLEE